MDPYEWLGLLIGLFVLLVLGAVLSYIAGLVIVLIPGAVIAFAVYWFTGSEFLAVSVFFVMGILAVLKKIF